MILNGLPWKQTEIILSFLRLHPRTAFQTLVEYDGYSISSKEFLPTVVDIIVIRVKFTHSSPFQFTLIHGPNIPGSYVTLLFTASNVTSITSHIYNWVLFLFWLCLFTLSEIISPLFSSSLWGTY